MNDEAPAKKRWITPWALWPLVFFALLIAGRLGMITPLLSVDVSTVENDSYQRSSRYDQDLAAITRFQDLGLRLECSPAGDRQLRCAISGDQRLKLQDARLAFYRADSAQLDQAIAWEDAAQALDLSLPRDGLWRVTLTGTIDGEAVRATQSLRL